MFVSNASTLWPLLAAIVVYRLPWTWHSSKLVMKLIHAGLNLLAFALVVISLVAVFDFHNSAKIPNMYSLHSWLGLAAVLLYCLQVAHLWPCDFIRRCCFSDVLGLRRVVNLKNQPIVLSFLILVTLKMKVVHTLLWLICHLNGNSVCPMFRFSLCTASHDLQSKIVGLFYMLTKSWKWFKLSLFWFLFKEQQQRWGKLL